VPTFAKFKAEQLKKIPEHIPAHCPNQSKNKVVLFDATEVYGGDCVTAPLLLSAALGGSKWSA
jgi:hypothetical protein